MDAADRARRWRRAEAERVCGTLEPWAYGVIARAEQCPSFFEFNHVSVDRPPALEVDELISVANRALAGLGHRRIDFEHLEHGEPFRAGFVARGWTATALVRMRFAGERPPPADPGIAEVEYDAVRELRVAWHEEDFPSVELGSHLEDARAVELARDARVLAAHGEDGTPLGFAQVEVDGAAAEITSAYVRADARGRGLGTALTAAAIRHAPPVRDLWITADADDRPQHLYARLGFVPVARDIQFLRVPA